MSTRAKFKVTAKTEREGGFSVKLEPVVGGSPENDNFFKWTPWGALEMGPVNPEVANQFEVGKEYYLDITPAEDK